MAFALAIKDSADEETLLRSRLKVFNPDDLPDSPEPARIVPTPAQIKILENLREMSDPEIIAELPFMGDDDLELICQEMAPEECDCERLAIPCECGWVTIRYSEPLHKMVPVTCPECEMEPAWDVFQKNMQRCPHLKSRYLSWDVLETIYRRLYREPPPPLNKTKALTQDARAIELAYRHRVEGVGLWNLDDDIYKAADWIGEDDDGEIVNYDRLDREAYTLRNGHREAGLLEVREAA